MTEFSRQELNRQLNNTTCVQSPYKKIHQYTKLYLFKLKNSKTSYY